MDFGEVALGPDRRNIKTQGLVGTKGIVTFSYKRSKRYKTKKPGEAQDTRAYGALLEPRIF
jgi:hypothetical protein